MDQQNYTKIKLIKKIAVIIMALLITSLVSAKSKQQQVFLDSSGKPIPNDVLLFLSSSVPSKSKKITQSDGFSKTKKTKTLKNDKKLILNPLLEKELLTALKEGRTARVTQLLRMGVKASYKNYKGETPLGIAVIRGWASTVVKLLENGADIHEKGARGVTLLHTASARGLTDVAKLLVRSGINPGTRTDKDWTPLHVAARYGHWQLVQFFLQQGVDPNIRNSDGKTALGLARHLRHMGIIKILSRVTTVRSIDPIKKKRKKRRSKKRRRK